MNQLLREIYDTKPNFVCKQTGEELLLIPLKDNVADFNQYLVLNELGAFIWDTIDSNTTAALLQERISAEFEVDDAILREDLEKFLPQLHQYTCAQ